MKQAVISTRNKDAVAILKSCLQKEYTADFLENPNDCLDRLQKQRYELLFIDILALRKMSIEYAQANNYRKLLNPFWKTAPSLEIIILCSQENIRKAVDAVRAGASNYLTFPLDKKEAEYVIETTLEATRAQSELDYFRDQFWDSDSLRIVSTKNSTMRTVFSKVKSVAPSATTVLITGETGTGKGLISKLIHSNSPRNSKPFISVHCGAIPENLIESELFGHERGAFTGAVKRKLGKFEIAGDGTIFLDEIGTMPLSAQIKLLQVLQEKHFQRVGGETDIYTSARIIAASNANLTSMIEKGEFRRDLYYRLNVFPIELPPLCERLEDIPSLANDFLFRLNTTHSKNIKSIHPEVLDAFYCYSWPGNIREMENLMERAYLIEKSSILTPESFPGELFTSQKTVAEIPLITSLTLAELRKTSYADIERNYLKGLLAKNQGRIDSTARAAGITTRQLHKLLTKHAIRKEEFKKSEFSRQVQEQ
ncbi:MAG: AAA domain-containing protein [Chitinivibrionales bacterium]|nr:AAA domain-containing protein [Chitinivibrionales bacterium]